MPEKDPYGCSQGDFVVLAVIVGAGIGLIRAAASVLAAFRT